jgi:hypothetical protein
MILKVIAEVLLLTFSWCTTYCDGRGVRRTDGHPYQAQVCSRSQTELCGGIFGALYYASMSYNK